MKIKVVVLLVALVAAPVKSVFADPIYVAVDNCVSTCQVYQFNGNQYASINTVLEIKGSQLTGFSGGNISQVSAKGCLNAVADSVCAYSFTAPGISGFLFYCSQVDVVSTNYHGAPLFEGTEHVVCATPQG